MEGPKIQEGLVHLAKADKCLKTGFLKRKPDYDSAAIEYGKAGLAFKNANQLNQAKEAFMSQGLAHENNQAPFFAAKAYEQAGVLMKEMKKLPEAAHLIEKASTLFLDSKNPDSAAIILRRFCRLLEKEVPDQVVRIYERTAEMFEDDDRVLQAVYLRGRMSRLLVRANRFGEAAISLNKEKNLYKEIESFPICHKRTISQFLALLNNNDFLGAYKCLQENSNIPGFKGSEGYKAMEQLLKSYDQQDQERVNMICSTHIIKYLDSDYVKLIMKLKVPLKRERKTLNMRSSSALLCPGTKKNTQELPLNTGGKI